MSTVISSNEAITQTNSRKSSVADETNILLSIIVPVYNLEPYLVDCIESLVNQGLKPENYEIIFVDDGSADGSYNLLCKYAERYSQLRVIHQENGGVSIARNTGLKNSRGKYVYFCDGDDYLAYGGLNKVVQLMESQQADTASFGFVEVKEDECTKTLLEDTLELDWYSGKKAPFYSGNAIRFVFARKLIVENNIEFVPGMRYGEDELFVYEVSRYINFEKHLYINNTLYNYRMRASSAVHVRKELKMKYHRDSMLTMAEVYKKRLSESALDKQMKKQTKRRFQYAVSNLLQDNLYCTDMKTDDLLSELKNKGLYPYGFCWEFLKPKKITTMLVNYFKFLFSIPVYYKFVRMIFTKSRKTQ